MSPGWSGASSTDLTLGSVRGFGGGTALGRGALGFGELGVGDGFGVLPEVGFGG